MVLTSTNEQIERMMLVADTINTEVGQPDGYSVVLNLVGVPGVGKTFGAKQYAVNNKKKLFFLRIGCREVSELEGFPKINEQRQTLQFIPPDDYPHATLPNEGKDCVVVFDEVDRGSAEHLNVLLGFMLDGIIGSYQCPRKALRVATMNGSTDMYTTPLPQFGKQRLCHIYLQPVREEWCGVYAQKASLDEQTIDFMQDNWTNIQKPVVFEDLAADYNSYTRSMGFVSALRKASKICQKKGIKVVDIIPLMVQGYIGFQWTAAFMEHIALKSSMPSVQDVNNKPFDVPIPNDPSIQVACVMYLLKSIEAIREQSAAAYLTRFPRDIAEFGFRNWSTVKPGILGTDSYVRWLNAFKGKTK